MLGRLRDRFSGAEARRLEANLAATWMPIEDFDPFFRPAFYEKPAPPPPPEDDDKDYDDDEYDDYDEDDE